MLFGSPRIIFQRNLKIGKRFLLISLENSIVPCDCPKRIETLLIPIAFAYILCVLEGGKKEETGDVRTPPKLSLSGLRAISTQLIRASIGQFRRFIRTLLQPFFKAWKIPAFS
ncbi:hypothetical protein C5S39_14335 [Candidatus Methanophagaceae archaeon]|nr:hypothetical protein C5S39_14335 [Methanophagales archaeon]